MESHILPIEDLTGIFQYAVLMTGTTQAAQSVMLDVFADSAEKIHHFRNGKSCEAWLVAKVRTRLLNKPFQPSTPDTAKSGGAASAAVSGGPAPDLAARFSRLHEPGRSGLALLYINRFTVAEIAQILQLPVEALAEAVDSARNALRGTEPASPAAAAAEGGAS